MPHLETSLNQSAVYSKNKFSRNCDINFPLKKGGGGNSLGNKNCLLEILFKRKLKNSLEIYATSGNLSR